jgi:hypothetical protein
MRLADALSHSQQLDLTKNDNPLTPKSLPSVHRQQPLGTRRKSDDENQGMAHRRDISREIMAIIAMRPVP